MQDQILNSGMHYKSGGDKPESYVLIPSLGCPWDFPHIENPMSNNRTGTQI